jgi:hypothetical protein
MRKRCATLAVRKVRCSDRFLWLSEGKGERSVESVETFDQKVELDYSALTEKQRLKRILIHCAFVEFCTTTETPSPRPKRARGQKDRSASASL